MTTTQKGMTMMDFLKTTSMGDKIDIKVTGDPSGLLYGFNGRVNQVPWYYSNFKVYFVNYKGPFEENERNLDSYIVHAEYRK